MKIPGLMSHSLEFVSNDLKLKISSIMSLNLRQIVTRILTINITFSESAKFAFKKTQLTIDSMMSSFLGYYSRD
jgi:hypothetical protein